MRAIIKQRNEIKGCSKYPFTGIHPVTGQIVIFFSRALLQLYVDKETGEVVELNPETGMYFNQHDFEVFIGEVTLINN